MMVGSGLGKMEGGERENLERGAGSGDAPMMSRLVFFGVDFYLYH